MNPRRHTRALTSRLQSRSEDTKKDQQGRRACLQTWLVTHRVECPVPGEMYAKIEVCLKIPVLADCLR
jgi:hypothetical protein